MFVVSLHRTKDTKGIGEAKYFECLPLFFFVILDPNYSGEQARDTQDCTIYCAFGTRFMFRVSDHCLP